MEFYDAPYWYRRTEPSRAMLDNFHHQLSMKDDKCKRMLIALAEQTGQVLQEEDAAMKEQQEMYLQEMEQMHEQQMQEEDY